MITGRFEITIDEVDELVEAIAVRTAGRIAAMFGHDPDADSEDRDARPDLPITGGQHTSWPVGQRNGPDATP